MPQTFQVLKCYKCNAFQVHQTKKATKWECKLCGEKQSMKRFYGVGTGKECRLQVQKLNKIRGDIDNLMCNKTDDDSYSGSPDHTEQDQIPVCSSVSLKSKWLNYVDPSEETQQASVEVETLNDNTEVVLELPPKRPRKCLNVRNRDIKKTKTESKNELQEHNDTISFKDCAKDVSNSMKNNTDINDCMNKPTNKAIHKMYVPPPMVNNSKWAEFVEETPSNVVDNDVGPIMTNPLDPVFPFLEDYDLDSILDL